jgi:hypothetical protein
LGVSGTRFAAGGKAAAFPTPKTGPKDARTGNEIVKAILGVLIFLSGARLRATFQIPNAPFLPVFLFKILKQKFVYLVIDNRLAG